MLRLWWSGRTTTETPMEWESWTPGEREVWATETAGLRAITHNGTGWELIEDDPPAPVAD